MAEIINGKEVSGIIRDEVKEKVRLLKDRGITVTLAVVLVGNDPASRIYVRNKENYAGIFR